MVVEIRPSHIGFTTMSFGWALMALAWLSLQKSIAWHGVLGFEPM